MVFTIQLVRPLVPPGRSAVDPCEKLVLVKADSGQPITRPIILRVILFHRSVLPIISDAIRSGTCSQGITPYR